MLTFVFVYYNALILYKSTITEKKTWCNSLSQNVQGDVTYEGVAKLKYLDSVISETLRMYPPLNMLV